MVRASGFTSFISTNSAGQVIGVSLNLNPTCGSAPKGKFEIAGEAGQVQTFSVYTANFNADEAQSLVGRVALLDPASLKQFTAKLTHQTAVHLFDLGKFAMESGLASGNPEVRGAFEKWDSAEKARERFYQLQRDVAEAIQYRQDQETLANRTFDWEKDRVYFAYAEAPRDQIFPGAPLVKALRQTSGADMWISTFNALACPNHPRHELTRQVLQQVINGEPHTDHSPNWKLYDDLNYLYHHGDLSDALLDSLDLDGRTPKEFPPLNFSLVEKQLPFELFERDFSKLPWFVESNQPFQFGLPLAAPSA